MNKVNRYVFILCCFIGSVFSLKGQSQHSLDSLEELLGNNPPSSNFAEICFDLSFAYRFNDIKKATKLMKKGLYSFSKEDTFQRAHFYNHIGTLCGEQYKTSEAFLYLDTALFLFRELDSKKGLSSVYGNLSILYGQTDNHTKALNAIYESLKIDEELGDKESIAVNLLNIVSINSIQGEYEEGIKNSKRALEIFSEIKISNHIAAAYFNIASFYVNLEKLDSALFYYEQSLEKYKEEENQSACGMVYGRIGSVYLKQGQLDLAIKYTEKALALEEQISSERTKIELQNNLGAIHFQNKNYLKSIACYEGSNETAHAFNIKRSERYAINGLIKNYVALQNYEKAYHYSLEMIALNDSILNEAKLQQIQDLEIKYETEKKEQANILLTQKVVIEKLNSTQNRYLAYGAILGLISVLIVSYLLIRQNRIQFLRQTLQIKHRLLRNQMNPHFIFNSLTAIQSFVYKNEPKAAGKYIASFAKLVRAILENSREEYISMSKEIQWLENYLNLQSLRFDNQFDYTVQLDENLDKEAVFIPPMLAQPFIENALEHGLSDIDYKGKLDIQFNLTKDSLEVRVLDNGIGLDILNNSSNNKHVSLATTITKERLSFLNQNKSKKIHFQMSNASPRGTLVSFTIPLKKIY